MNEDRLLYYVNIVTDEKSFRFYVNSKEKLMKLIDLQVDSLETFSPVQTQTFTIERVVKY